MPMNNDTARIIIKNADALKERAERYQLCQLLLDALAHAKKHPTDEGVICDTVILSPNEYPVTDDHLTGVYLESNEHPNGLLIGYGDHECADGLNPVCDHAHIALTALYEWAEEQGSTYKNSDYDDDDVLFNEDDLIAIRDKSESDINYVLDLLKRP